MRSQDAEKQTVTPQPQAVLQHSLRGLLSTMTAIAILQGCFVWLSSDLQSLGVVLLMFGCSGLLTAINIWSAERYDVMSACTGTIVITLFAGMVLKLFDIHLQQWLTATMFFLFIQLAGLFAALFWPACQFKRMATIDSVESSESCS